MPRLEVISVDDRFCRGMLEEFKQYASIPDGSRDALLYRILKNAALRVQEYADKALLETTLRVTLPIPEPDGIVRLYMGGGDIQSLVDGNGNDIPFDPLPDGRLQLFRRGGTATVEYTTRPNEGDRVLLQQVVVRYATADYDGADTQELNRILSEAVL